MASRELNARGDTEPRGCPRRYRVLSSDGEHSLKHVTDNLDDAVAALRRENGIEPEVPEGTARSILRRRTSCSRTAIRLWGSLPDGRWLSLDPEDAQDALRSPEGRAAFEGGIALPPWTGAPMIYRLRMILPDGAIAPIVDHPSIRSAFEAIANVWFFPFPIELGFTSHLWAIHDAGDCFALSARPAPGYAAVPLTLLRAEEALPSNHAALSLEQELRQELTQQT